MAVSIGVETSFSTTSGDAPGYVVITTSAGSSRDGMSSCLRFVSARPPNTADTIVMRAISARLRRLRTERFDTVLVSVAHGCRRDAVAEEPGEGGFDEMPARGRVAEVRVPDGPVDEDGGGGGALVPVLVGEEAGEARGPAVRELAQSRVVHRGGDDRPIGLERLGV